MRTEVVKADEYKVGGEPGKPEIQLAQDWKVVYVLEIKDAPSCLHDFDMEDARNEVWYTTVLEGNIVFVEWEIMSYRNVLDSGFGKIGDKGAIVFHFTAYGKESRQ